jgi:uncharacterized protein (DUF2267 family)
MTGLEARVREVTSGLGDAVALRPGTTTNRAARRVLGDVASQLRHTAGRVDGLRHRLGGAGPDPDATGTVLADRIRSTIGPLEKRLDLPHVHVMVDEHLAVLHGEVGSATDADRIESAVAGVAGVHGVESYLRVGLGRGDTRPSQGRASRHPSTARRRLLDAVSDVGVGHASAPLVVGSVLGALAERLPDDERAHVAAHLPTDVRGMLTPPRRIHGGPARTPAEVVRRVRSAAALDEARAALATRRVLHVLRELVPEEADDVAAVLPADLRDLWEHDADAVVPVASV